MKTALMLISMWMEKMDPSARETGNVVAGLALMPSSSYPDSLLTSAREYDFSMEPAPLAAVLHLLVYPVVWYRMETAV